MRTGWMNGKCFDVMTQMLVGREWGAKVGHMAKLWATFVLVAIALLCHQNSMPLLPKLWSSIPKKKKTRKDHNHSCKL